MKAKIFLLTLVSTLLLFAQKVTATHIKAGDITAVRDASNPYKYTFTLTLYYNSTAISQPYGLKPPGQGLVIDQGILNFGDNTSAVTGAPTSYLYYSNTGTTMCKYVLVHTYSGASTFTVYYQDFARINGILNMTSSGDQYLFIDARLTVDPLIGKDALPIMYTPPIDQANRGKIYTYNPAAYDPEGDSLSFELVPPKTVGAANVPGYQNPAQARGGESSDGGPAYFTINSKTGQIEWNVPNVSGPYNIAIKVTEWRNGRAIGYIIRDMQIIVGDFDNDPPLITLPTPDCNNIFLAEAGQQFDDTLIATDPNNPELLLIEGFGQPFLFTDNKMQLTVIGAGGGNTKAPPVAARYQWTPNCSQVRNQPYNVVFKATDRLSSASLQLTDVKSISIKVLGPKPIINTVAVQNSNSIQLTWSGYNTCTLTGVQFYIYRAVCDSNYTFTPCLDGLTEPTNYELIAKVAANANTYLDNNHGKGLKGGITYYYMMMAVFPLPGKGQSRLSTVKWATIGTSAPLVTTISVTETNATTGKVQLAWRKPTPGSGATAPFTYKVFRAEAGTAPIFSQIGNVMTENDTTLLDQNLNTASKAYSYKIELTDALNNVYTSEIATTLFLGSQPLDAGVKLTWPQSSLPWAISRYHIYSVDRNKRLATISGHDTTYTDEGLTNCETYSYYVEAVGRYCFDNNTDSITSKSQISSAIPFSTKTVPPDLFLVKGGCPGLDCSLPAPLPPYENTIKWKYGTHASCANFRKFNVYFSDNDADETQLIATTTDTFFVHQQERGYAGCYQVQIIILFQGKEYTSEKSNKICVDNCYCFDLPNVFTPNGDQKNDKYQPMKPARFIDEVDFKVYNRWGKPIFSKDDDVNINWDGDNVTEGVYYYQADVKFNTVNKAARNQTFKGWVQLIR